MTKPKTVIMLGDLHCGHQSGLTHPDWQSGSNSASKLREEMWKWYADEVAATPKPHLVVANGDLIDGRGEASGGRELITVQQIEQAAMASAALKVWDARNYAMSYGTPYHSGKKENYEDLIAKDLKCKPKNHLFLGVNGVKFDIKHKVGGSGIPHGRHTATAKADTWNMVWADEKLQPRCDVFIRSHVHFFQYSGNSSKLRMTLPALQAAATEYGARQCEGYVDFGFVVFTIHEDGSYEWEPRIRKLKGVKETTTKY